MGIKIREFRGLKTYIDSADIDEGYFNTFKNIRTFPGYAESVQFNASEDNLFNLPPGAPNGAKIVLIDYIFIDNDKQENELEGDILKYVYRQSLVKYRLTITRLLTGYYVIHICLPKETLVWEGTQSNPGHYVGFHYSSSSEDQYPYIINDKGIVKILFNEEAGTGSYWVGKIKRSRWLSNGDTYTFTNQLYHKYDIVMRPLVYDLIKSSGWANFTTELSNVQRTVAIPVTGYEYKEKISANHSIYGYHHNYRFKTTDGFPIYDKKGERGYFWVFRTKNEETGVEHYVAFLDDVLQFYESEDKNTPELMGCTGSRSSTSNQFKPYSWRDDGEYKDWEQVGIPTYVWNAIGNGTTQTGSDTVWFWANKVGLYAEVELVADSGIPPEYPYSEYLMTYRIRDNEFPVRFDSYRSGETEKYIVKVNINITEDNPPAEVEAIVLYGRYASNKIDIKKKDFEQFGVIPLLSKEISSTLLNSPYLSETSPNGIFLTQTVGKAIDVDTYKIETAFDDYINVNGVPFILKNGNVLYPSVGNGIVHSDMFYPENYVPQVDGKYLSVLENKLAVFAENREEMTLIDFQPVEGQLAFFIRGSASYKIKNYWDLIETAEGNIISLRDGIYIDNGETRKLISYPINDIIKANYNTSSVYYNSYEKEIIYICAVGIYLFRFETESWTQIDLEGLELGFNGGGGIGITVTNGEPTTLIDIIDDYNGNLYFVLSNNKVYKLGYVAAVGTIGLDNVDFGDMTFMKRLNWVGCNAEGTIWLITYNKNIEPSGVSFTNRMTKIIDTPLLDRVPSEEVDFSLKINGILYNVELGIEAYPARKL